MDMYGTSNAHAALPDTGHAYLVCCGGVSGLSNSCSSPNAQVVVKLSAVSNAHVRQGDQLDYPGSNNVCLGDWPGTISIGYQDNNCDGFDTTVASMAKVPTNSHIGDGNAYIHKICAKYNVPPASSNSGSSNQNSSGSSGSSVGNFFNNLLGLDSSPNNSSQPGGSNSSDATSYSASSSGIGGGGEGSLSAPAIISSGNQGAGEASQPSITNSPGDNPNGNVLAAAAGLSGLSFMNNLGPKIGSIIALFGLIFVGRRLYLRKK